MLGEGFDLPELKIAAIHDTRQSIAITLQFIGRFTRTSHDSQLGKASFIINLANPPIEEELFELYSRDADWNALLPILNDDTTKKEIDLNNYVLSFKGMEESKVPFQNITPALSTIAYRVGKTWRQDFGWISFLKINLRIAMVVQMKQVILLLSFLAL
jgi:superfamily II DNA or RNA helicase